MAVQTEGPRAKHPSAGRPLDAVATGLMIILCLSWGLNQVAIKFALADIPPFIQGALRSLGAPHDAFLARFGPNGLARVEALIAAEDAKRREIEGATIDAEYEDISGPPPSAGQSS